MKIFKKPCGCRGTGFLQTEHKLVTIRLMWVSEDDNMPQCPSQMLRPFPTYTSTDIIELQKEKKVIENKKYSTEKITHYILYGCLKCGETWREKHKVNTYRKWKEWDDIE